MGQVVKLEKLVSDRKKDLHNKINMLQFLYTERYHEALKLKDQLIDAKRALATLEKRGER